MATTETAPLPSPTYSRFACVGAGFSGIGLGCQLRRWHGITDVRIFEREPDLGGTWLVNQYPGCACDVPSGLYSFSFECNPNWTRVLPSNDELWAYLRHVAAKYDLVERISFNTSVDRCEWLEERARWRVYATDVRTGGRVVHECQFLFSGTGILVEPRELDVPGVDTFQGSVFHTARWPKDVELKGKDVVLFGNGCTAAQIVPAIVDQTRHLTQLIRSKHWIMPAIDEETRHFMQWTLNYVPGAMWLQRAYLFWNAERELTAFYYTKEANAFRQGREDMSKAYVRRWAPAKYHDMLIPDFPLGCKRRIFDTGYCQALNKPNITLSEERAVEVVPEGVRTRDRLIKADVIICANGFRTNKILGNMEVVGRGGITAEQHWDKFGGPGAYNCSVMHGFPNFFLLLGPNATTGHTSCVVAIENSVNYALRVIKPVLEGQATIAELKWQPEKEYMDKLQDDLSKTVFNANCGNWYSRYEEGEQGGKKWNASTYPWSQPYYWWRSFFPTWKHWQYRGTVTKKRRNRHIIRLLLFVMTMMSLVSLRRDLVLTSALKLRDRLPKSLQRLIK